MGPLEKCKLLERHYADWLNIKRLDCFALLQGNYRLKRKYLGLTGVAEKTAINMINRNESYVCGDIYLSK